MRFFALASAAIMTLAGMATALPSPHAAADLAACSTVLTLSQAQAILAGFEMQIPGLSADVQNMGSLAGIAEDIETFLLHFGGEITSVIAALEAFGEVVLAAAA